MPDGPRCAVRVVAYTVSAVWDALEVAATRARLVDRVLTAAAWPVTRTLIRWDDRAERRRR